MLTRSVPSSLRSCLEKRALLVLSIKVLGVYHLDLGIKWQVIATNTLIVMCADQDQRCSSSRENGIIYVEPYPLCSEMVSVSQLTVTYQSMSSVSSMRECIYHMNNTQHVISSDCPVSCFYFLRHFWNINSSAPIHQMCRSLSHAVFSL